MSINEDDRVSYILIMSSTNEREFGRKVMVTCLALMTKQTHLKII